jgi:hypothetical protein
VEKWVVGWQTQRGFLHQRSPRFQAAASSAQAPAANQCGCGSVRSLKQSTCSSAKKVQAYNYLLVLGQRMRSQQNTKSILFDQLEDEYLFLLVSFLSSESRSCGADPHSLTTD